MKLPERLKTMNDRSAEKFYILQATFKEKLIIEALRHDDEYGTESFFWKLKIDTPEKVSAESYSFSEAVVALFEGAEKMGLMKDVFIA